MSDQNITLTWSEQGLLLRAIRDAIDDARQRVRDYTAHTGRPRTTYDWAAAANRRALEVRRLEHLYRNLNTQFGCAAYADDYYPATARTPSRLPYTYQTVTP